MTDNIHPFRRHTDDPLTGISLRQPPSNLQAEQALLGAILANNKAFHLVSDFLRPEHFADPLHQRIFKELGRRILDGAAPDAVSMKAWMAADMAAAEPNAGPSYLAHLLGAMVGILNAAEYGRAIREAYLRREMVAIGEHAVNCAFDNEHMMDETAADVVAKLDHLLAAGVTDHPGIAWDEALERTIAAIERAANGECIVGVRTGMASVDDALGAFEPGTLNILGGRPGMGKAQPLDASILLADGTFRLMGELRLGDGLASIDGAPSRVMGIYPRGMMQTFRVTFSDGRSTEVSADHLWEISFRKWSRPRVLGTRELTVMLQQGQYQGRLSVRMVSGDFGRGDDLPIDPYVLGCLLGDGDISGVTPRLTSADPELIAEVQARLGYSAEVRSTGTDGISYSIVSTSYEMGSVAHHRRKKRELARSLQNLGIAGCVSETKFIPNVYLSADRQSRLDLLRGLMDTDGWAEAHGTVRYSSCSRLLAEGVRDLVRSLGGCCSIVTKRTSFTKNAQRHFGMTSYMCRIRHPHAEAFFLLRRKSDRASRTRNPTVRLNVVNVQPARTVPVQCIAVTHPSRLYVTNDYIVTHNTALALQWAIAAARAGHGVAMFSLEMAAIALTRRAIAAASGIAVTNLRRGWIKGAEGTIVTAHKGLMGLPITIEDAASLSVGSMMLRARKARRKHGLGLIVVDHLHIVEPDQADVRQGATWAVGRVSKALHAMAKSLGVPVLALAQLNREVEKRDEKRPTKSDLRMSGDIEQNAETISFVYRPEYYLSKTAPERIGQESDDKYEARVRAWQDDRERLFGKAELILAKVRDGEEAIVPLRWHGETTSFSEASE